MDETKLTAALPDLRIEILRRDLPEEGAEALTIEIKATPSLDAVSGALLRGLAAPMALGWMNPMAAWAQMMRAAWMPLLGPMMAPLLPPTRSRD